MRAIPKRNKQNVAPHGELKIDLTHKVISKNRPDSEPQVEAIKLVRQERKYELITPLFGGGVEAGQNDPVTLISAKGIRGHLRFWWRATRGGQFGKDGIEQMCAREAEIWGAASTVAKPSPSQVQIAVKITATGTAEHPFRVALSQMGNIVTEPTAAWQHTAYVAFPLQPNAKEPDYGVGMITKAVTSGVKFTLEITFPAALQKDVAAALWAWETFGGVGARTRRGFGALLLTGLKIHGDAQQISSLDDKTTVYNAIRQALTQHVVTGAWPEYVPHLTPQTHFKLAAPLATARAAWSNLIAKLKAFRQMRSGAQGRGRSKWPEPDEIRYRTGQKHPDHSQEVFDIPIPCFPRGIFGAPIIFHFKDANQNNIFDPRSDPRDATLKPAPCPQVSSDRWASPLILRPLGRGLGLALLLTSAQPPSGFVLEFANNPNGSTSDDAPVILEQAEANDIEPLQDNDGKGQRDVLRAFLRTL